MTLKTTFMCNSFRYVLLMHVFVTGYPQSKPAQAQLAGPVYPSAPPGPGDYSFQCNFNDISQLYTYFVNCNSWILVYRSPGWLPSWSSGWLPTRTTTAIFTGKVPLFLP